MVVKFALSYSVRRPVLRGLTSHIPVHYGKAVIDIFEVASGIYRFDVPIDLAQYAPTVYIIDEPAVALIEPGPSAAIPHIREALGHLGIERLSYIIPTHVHMDHAGGAGTLAGMYPGSRVLVHPRGAKHAINPSRLIDSVKMVWGDDFEAHFGPITAVPESQVKAVEDGEVIDLGGRELQLLYAPGHAPHHIVIYDRKVCGLFCGEALGLPVYQMPTVAPMSFDLEAYLSTIDRLRQLNLGMQMLLYSHGGVELEPDALMDRAEDNARIFGKMVLESLRQGESPDDISREISEYFSDRYGMDVDERGIYVTVAGYRLYFESKGLVQVVERDSFM